jgi:ribonuclease HII
VAAAVVIPEGMPLDAVDSKRLTERRREAWVEQFKATAAEQGIRYGYYWIDVPTINERGIGWANREIFRQLILKYEADEYWVDGNHKLQELGDKQDRYQSVVRGDERIPVIAAASILAKTYRDAIMRELHERYPQYHWDRNKGYGSAAHISAIKTFGRSPYHRGLFAQTVEGKVYKNKNHQEFAQPLLLLGPGTAVLTLLLTQFLKNLIQFVG